MIKQERRSVVKDVLTIGEAAEFLGIHPDTLRNWDRSGKFRAQRHPINGYRLYSRDLLEQLSAALRPTPIVQENGYG